MQIKLISDIHVEFGHPNSLVPGKLPNEGVDVLVIAGDLAVGYKKRLKKALRTFCDRFEQVIFVLGNHDYWHSSIERRHESLRNLSSKIDNLHFLEKSSTVIDGQRFIGATGWYPNSVIAMQMNESWPDQRLIEGKREAIILEHKKTEEFFKNNVQRGDIVVTHHLPVKQCAHPRWEHHSCNVFFSSDFDTVIWHQPDFWFFGHTHDFRHLTLGDTELICNPYGYPHETMYQGYTDELIIDTNL